MVRTCAELGAPIVPRGAGTGLSGGANAVSDCVVLDAAIALGGTVTGEHGVGILKRDGMRRELDPGSLALQAAVRRALDPREVFNPGKG